MKIALVAILALSACAPYAPQQSGPASLREVPPWYYSAERPQRRRQATPAPEPYRQEQRREIETVTPPSAAIDTGELLNRASRDILQLRKKLNPPVRYPGQDELPN